MPKKTKFETKGKARVAIAKDVLKWMDTQKMDVQQSGYLLSKTGSLFSGLDVLDNADLKEKLQGKECQVCALGAVFLTTVDRFNQVGCADLLDEGDWRGGALSLKRRHLTNYLEKYFAPLQLCLIESAFECGSFRTGFNSNHSALKKIAKAEQYGVKLHRKGLGPDKRLRKIMNNIIKNNGTFKP